MEREGRDALPAVVARRSPAGAAAGCHERSAQKMCYTDQPAAPIHADLQGIADKHSR